MDSASLADSFPVSLLPNAASALLAVSVVQSLGSLCIYARPHSMGGSIVATITQAFHKVPAPWLSSPYYNSPILNNLYVVS